MAGRDQPGQDRQGDLLGGPASQVQAEGDHERDQLGCHTREGRDPPNGNIARTVLSVLKRIAVDVTPLRASRDYRLLVSGEAVSNLGTQAALVALPYQIFVTSHSATLVGLLGAFELGPMVVAALLGGAFADRADRRRLLAFAQIGVMAAAASLAIVTFVGGAPVIVILVLGGVLAGSAMLDNVTRAAIVPGVLPRDKLPSGLAFHYGVYQVTGIIGPAFGGVIIGVTSVGVAYAVDATSCLAVLAAALAIRPQPPQLTERPVAVLRSIAEGLRFVRSNRALKGSFVIDLVAMTFGMPRALFAVLSFPLLAPLLVVAIKGTALALEGAGWDRERRIERTARAQSTGSPREADGPAGGQVRGLRPR